MATVPHNFPQLRRCNTGVHRPSILILGAGASVGLVPGPSDLLAEKRVSAETKLNYPSAPSTGPTPSSLYEWAEAMITHLRSKGDPNPKLTLARSLDIPSDRPRWIGNTSVMRSTPRHRVIARFARERLFEQVWSLNWDCRQESAFESVGLSREVTAKSSFNVWPTIY